MKQKKCGTCFEISLWNSAGLTEFIWKTGGTCKFHIMLICVWMKKIFAALGV